MSNNELTHHGIRGMKWGVRRYQKKDGSLTVAGKKRYAKDTTKDSTPKKRSSSDPKKAVNNLLNKMKPAKKTAKKDEVDEATDKKKKPLSEMSDDEIRQAISRIKLEKEYASLTAVEKSRVKKFIDNAVDKTADTFVNQGLPKIVNSLIDKALKDKTNTSPDDPNSRDLLKKKMEDLTDSEAAKLAKRRASEKVIADMFDKKNKGKKSDDDDNDDNDDNDEPPSNNTPKPSGNGGNKSGNDDVRNTNKADDIASTGTKNKKSTGDSDTKTKKESSEDYEWIVEDGPERRKNDSDTRSKKPLDDIVDPPYTERQYSIESPKSDYYASKAVTIIDKALDKGLDFVSNEPERVQEGARFIESVITDPRFLLPPGK